MAWTGAGFGQFPSYGTAPEDPLRYFHGGEGDEEEDNEDFYGDEDNNYQDPSTTNSSAHPDNYSSEVRILRACLLFTDPITHNVGDWRDVCYGI